MIDVRIVCTHDAVKTAQTLQRLLTAEDYRVELCYGRASLHALEAAQDKREAVLLIWSLDAPSTTYMLEWATRIDPARLVEVARISGAPHVEKRKASVVDFTSWSGERGGAAWRTLVDRLRVVSRALEPPKPPPLRAAIALGAASAMAVTGALVVRINDANNLAPPQNTQVMTTPIEEFGTGGALYAVEPASFDDEAIAFNTRRARAAMLDAPTSFVLAAEPAPYEPAALRRETVLERITGTARSLLNPTEENSSN